MIPANLLPWRQYRRTRCLRLWGVMFTGSLVMILTALSALRVDKLLALRARQSEWAGIHAVEQTLKARQLAWQAAQKHAAVPEAAPRVAWRPALTSLSALIPEQAWLTELRYQPPGLVLTGYATTAPALTAMRDALGRVDGFSPGTVGALQQDKQGRWAFTFQLKHQG